MAVPSPEKPEPTIATSKVSAGMTVSVSSPIGYGNVTYVPVGYTSVTWDTRDGRTRRDNDADERRAAARTDPRRDEGDRRGARLPRRLDRGRRAALGHHEADRLLPLRRPP